MASSSSVFEGPKGENLLWIFFFFYKNLLTPNCALRIYPLIGGCGMEGRHFSYPLHSKTVNLYTFKPVPSKYKSILKSRDISLPTKVHLVKAMAFQVVMYGCESWTIKKAEGQKIDAFELWCWRRLLRVP